MIGQKFGKLTVLAKGPKDEKWRRSTWVCQCDCGNTKTVFAPYFRTSKSPSCGCDVYEKVAEAATKYRALEDYLANTKRSKECLLWQGCLTPQGYGTLGSYTPKTKAKRSGLVHRRVFELVNGFVPPVVMHTCDTPQCINPEHLRGGTKSDNTKDAARKSRLAAQRNAEKVVYKRKRYTLRELAAHTGVPLQTLYWRHRHGKQLVPV